MIIEELITRCIKAEKMIKPVLCFEHSDIEVKSSICEVYRNLDEYFKKLESLIYESDYLIVNGRKEKEQTSTFSIDPYGNLEALDFNEMKSIIEKYLPMCILSQENFDHEQNRIDLVYHIRLKTNTDILLEKIK